jgi:ABC-type nickel/cobalt efflux system permease component RcnA
MDAIINLVNNMDIGSLIVIGAAFWICYSKLSSKIEKGFESVHERFKQLDDRFVRSEQKFDTLDQKFSEKIDRVDEKVTDIDRRLCRLEGAFSSKDCCMIKDERQMKKAE